MAKKNITGNLDLSNINIGGGAKSVIGTPATSKVQEEPKPIEPASIKSKAQKKVQTKSNNDFSGLIEEIEKRSDKESFKTTEKGSQLNKTQTYYLDKKALIELKGYAVAQNISSSYIVNRLIQEFLNEVRK